MNLMKATEFAEAIGSEATNKVLVAVAEAEIPGTISKNVSSNEIRFKLKMRSSLTKRKSALRLNRILRTPIKL